VIYAPVFPGRVCTVVVSMTFNIEEGMIRRVRSIFRKKAEDEPPKTTEKESEWVSIRTMLMRVLGRFPDARAAVVEGLTMLTGGATPEWVT
jgi:hypothetical protein